MPKAKKTFQTSCVKPLDDSGNSPKSFRASILDQPPPPTPNTNRRILHDVATIPNIPSDHPNSFRLSLMNAETTKVQGDPGLGGASVAGSGIHDHPRRRRGKPPEIDEIDPQVVKKATKDWIDRELSEEQVKLVESAGILTPAAAAREGGGKEIDQDVLQLQERGNWNKDGGTSADGVVMGGNSKGKKRIRDEAEKENSEQQENQEVQIDWDENIDYPWDCDEIRGKIRTFIENGGMKVTAFQRAIRTNPNSYGRFMKLRGPWSGQDNNTFEGATRFFKSREAASLPVPKKPKTTINSQSSKSTKTSYNYDHPDISDIHLDGEDTDSVPVFDSCNEIRRKISAHLRKPGVTQAQFLRDISAQIHTSPQPVNIQARQLRCFQAKSGSLAGNTSRVYYGAYVYFEKCRIKEGKKKSKHRLEMEKRWGHQGGVDIKRLWGRVWIRQGEVPTWDQFGCLHIAGRRPRHER